MSSPETVSVDEDLEDEPERDLVVSDADGETVIADIIRRQNRQDERINTLEAEVKHKDAKIRKLESTVEDLEGLIKALKNRNDTLVDLLFDREKWENTEYADKDAEPLAERVEQLGDRLVELEQNIAAISDLGREKTTKEEKIAAMVQFAMNQATDPTAERVALTPKEIKGVTGVGLRHAYNYLDELPGEFEFLLDKADVKQYGDLEIDKSSQKRALIVDLELLHSDEQALNKFNNRTEEKGGR